MGDRIWSRRWIGFVQGKRGVGRLSSDGWAGNGCIWEARECCALGEERSSLMCDVEVEVVLL